MATMSGEVTSRLCHSHMNRRKVTLAIATILAGYDRGMRRNHVAPSRHSTRTAKYNNFDVLLSPPPIRRPKAHHHWKSSSLLQGGGDENVTRRCNKDGAYLSHGGKWTNFKTPLLSLTKGMVKKSTSPNTMVRDGGKWRFAAIAASRPLY